MPGRTFPAGPSEVRRDDVDLDGGGRRRVVDMKALKGNGKLLTFDDGTRLELQRGQTILVHRSVEATADA